MQNNDAKNYEIRWGTSSPLVYNDKKYGPLLFTIQGSCTYETALENTDDLQSMVSNFLLSEALKFIAEMTYDTFDELSLKITSDFNEYVANHSLPNVIIKKVLVASVELIEESKSKMQTSSASEQVIVQTDIGNKDGQNKCPKCGSTDISTNVNNGKLRCNFCRFEFEPEKVEGLVGDISQLNGQVIGSGATDIVANTNDVITLKCTSCGAEVVIDTASVSQARCHWCRNMLSINQQIPNGTIPDTVLPFTVKKDDARMEIEKFVGKRKFFAHPKFRAEFTTENIMGVYFPYMLVDVNAHATLIGEGEHQTRMYYVKDGDKSEARYDADLYHVERDFDLTINGLSIESNSDRLNTSNKNKTNNIINAIMPFDTENCVKYNANYLKGYTSERRDTNIEQLKAIVDVQSKDIARFAANDTLSHYDRGVAWSSENLTVKGEQWQAAYLPVWLYSYLQVKGNKKLLHYVAVNARTKETMGSVPIHMPKLLAISFLVELLGFLLMFFVDFDYNWIFLFAGIIYFFIMLSRYRNAGARHTYEKETKREMINLKQVDRFIKSKKGLSNSRMTGANNTRVNGESSKGKIMNSFNTQQIGNTVINTVTSSSPVANFVKNSIDKNGDDK
mgnify:CR=1 FL=1